LTPTSSKGLSATPAVYRSRRFFPFDGADELPLTARARRKLSWRLDLLNVVFRRLDAGLTIGHACRGLSVSRVTLWRWMRQPAPQTYKCGRRRTDPGNFTESFCE